MTEENGVKEVFRASICLASGRIFSINCESKIKAVRYANGLNFNDLSVGGTVKFHTENQMLQVNTANFECAFIERLVPGMEGYDDPIGTFIYH